MQEQTSAIHQNEMLENKKKGRMAHKAGTYFIKNIHYYILLILPLAYFLIFRYGPIAGNILAFRKFVPGGSIYGSKWIGFTYFRLFLQDPNFWTAFRNTWVLSLMHLAVTFTVTLAFALLVNEIRSSKLRNVVQTVTYFPNFVSIVVVVGLMKELLSPTNGMINGLLAWAGFQPIFFMNEPGWFRTLYISSDVWQYTGWNSIIFIAAMASIDTQLYEAAEMDGAGRWKQIVHVTLPQIMPTLSVVFILSAGQLLNVGFEKILLMYTPSNSQVSDVIETFVFRMGLENNNYSYATAVGLFSGLIGLGMVLLSNVLAKKVTGHSLY